MVAVYLLRTLLEDGYRVVFGPRHIVGLEIHESHRHWMEEVVMDPLSFRLNCECGAQLFARFDDYEERANFIAQNAIAA